MPLAHWMGEGGRRPGEGFAADRMNEALVQGVETARAVLATPPQGQAADAAFVKWLMEHQKEAGVFTIVSGLVDQFTDSPAAKITAQEIAERVRQAQVGSPAGT